MKLGDVTPDVTIKTDVKPPVDSSTTETKDTDVKDESESSPDEKDVKDDPGKSSDTEEMPWGKDPRFKKDLHLLKAVKNLLDANSIEDIDELVSMVEDGKKVKGKQVDLSKLDEIMEKASRLDKYEAYWAQQKEQQRRQEEEPDDTIKRLESQINALKSKDEAKSQAEQQAIAARRAVEFYERTVSEILEDKEDIPKEHHKLISLIMGVQNQANDIDITDRKAVKKVFNDNYKAVKDFIDAIKKQGAEEYRKGKLEIPKVTTTAPTTTNIEKKVYLKDARAALAEKFKALAGS